MAKIKIAKKSTRIDMTAMCDVAFLLLSFFIMTATSKVPEPKPVDTPASTAIAKLPEKDLLTITIGDSSVYIGISERDIRKEALDYMARKFNAKFSPTEVEEFSLMDSFGVPLEQLGSLIELKPSDRNKPSTQGGIPYAEEKMDLNELSEWIYAVNNATIIKQQLDLKPGQEVKYVKIAIRGGSKEKYPTVKKVIDILQKQGLNDYFLVTSLRDDNF
jgi:biopolymer transport protein ExbD